MKRALEAKENTESSSQDEEKTLIDMEAIINKYTTGKEIAKVIDINPGVLEIESENTYVINSIEDLVFFAYDVRNGNTYENETVK